MRGVGGIENHLRPLLFQSYWLRSYVEYNDDCVRKCALLMDGYDALSKTWDRPYHPYYMGSGYLQVLPGKRTVSLQYRNDRCRVAIDRIPTGVLNVLLRRELQVIAGVIERLTAPLCFW
jgi:hypothetical protein